jgi:uncharacterized protein (TIGR00251 family)
MGWHAEDPDGLRLFLHVQPGAKKTEVAGLHGGRLKIRLAAPPIDGRANAALCAFLAKALGVPKSAVSVESGEAARQKTVRVDAPCKAGDLFAG